MSKQKTLPAQRRLPEVAESKKITLPMLNLFN